MTTLHRVCEKLTNNVMFVTAKGSLDINTIPGFEKMVAEIFAAHCYQIIFDLRELIYISSRGSGLFIQALQTVEKKSGKIVIVGPNPKIMEIFKMLGLNQIFTFVATKDAAIKVFAQANPKKM